MRYLNIYIVKLHCFLVLLAICTPETIVIFFLDYNQNSTLETNDFNKNTLGLHLMFKKNKAYKSEHAYNRYKLVPIYSCMYDNVKDKW